MIKNVIFDWSGVINNNVKSVYFAVTDVFKAYGAKRITFKEFRQKWEQPYMLFYNKYLPNLTLKEEQKVYYPAIEKYNHYKIYPGIKNSLEKLKSKKLNLFVISGDPPRKLNSELKEFNLVNIFTKVKCGAHDKIKTGKEIIHSYKLKTSETVFVGDATEEIYAGRTIGIRSITVTWGFQNENKLKTANPDFIAHNLKELEKIILG